MKVKLILPALAEAESPFWRPIKYSLFPPLGLATLAAYLSPDDEVDLQDQHVEVLHLDDHPDLVNKVSPVIARIFSPLVLVMLVIYLFAILYSGKNPYSDREFLIIFNLLLIGVMAIIFFSIAESTRGNKSTSANWVLLLLSFVTILVNGIALSAILFRISEWGITPNRTAVLGGNILILVNLLLVTFKLYNVVQGKAETEDVGKPIPVYIPVYALWAIIVVFFSPLLFGFK